MTSAIKSKKYSKSTLFDGLMDSFSQCFRRHDRKSNVWFRKGKTLLSSFERTNKFPMFLWLLSFLCPMFSQMQTYGAGIPTLPHQWPSFAGQLIPAAFSASGIDHPPVMAVLWHCYTQIIEYIIFSHFPMLFLWSSYDFPTFLWFMIVIYTHIISDFFLSYGIMSYISYWIHLIMPYNMSY